MVRRLLFERIQEEVVRLRLTLPLPFSSYGKALPILLIYLLMNTVCWSYDLGTAICPKPPASLFENRRHSHQLCQRFICHLEGSNRVQENSRTTRQGPNVTYFAAAKISYHRQRSILQREQEESVLSCEDENKERTMEEMPETLWGFSCQHRLY
jgi:hypothetical protein